MANIGEGARNLESVLLLRPSASHPTSKKSPWTDSPWTCLISSGAHSFFSQETLKARVEYFLLHLFPVPVNASNSRVAKHDIGSSLVHFLGAPGPGHLTYSLLHDGRWSTALSFLLMRKLKALLGSHSYTQTFLEHLLHMWFCARDDISPLQNCRI